MLTSEFSNIKLIFIKALTNELPGEKAHRLMLPQGRDLSPVADKNTILQSSVLMLLFPKYGTINTCLIRRPPTMRNHVGQISFPGGRHEPSDNDLAQTALRESFEEIGTEVNSIEILGKLSPLYVQVSNFMINPFLGWCETMPKFEIDNHEVDEIFTIPVGKFLNHTRKQFQKVSTIQGIIEVPGFYIDNLFIWGATAMIISEFNEIFKSLSIIKSP